MHWDLSENIPYLRGTQIVINFFFFTTYKNNSLKEKIERLTDLEPYNINIINLLLNNAIGEPNLMIAHEMSIFNDIGTEILI